MCCRYVRNASECESESRLLVESAEGEQKEPGEQGAGAAHVLRKGIYQGLLG